jgi:tRNA pseudouridine13 synthase
MAGTASGKGIGGTIKSSADDFIVEEITKNGVVLELGRNFNGSDLGDPSQDGKFTRFVLKKRDWNTVQALKAIANKLGRGIRSMGFAGTKDRTSTSSQLCSMFGVEPEKLSKVYIKDIEIHGAWPSQSPVKMGDLLGNRFTVKIKDASAPEEAERIDKELGGVFPNYFGEQRFGFRSNNVAIGVDLMKGNLESATMRYLTDTTNESNEDSVNARIRLAEEKDFKEALNYFPKHLAYERSMIDYLSRFPTDYGNALRKLPRTLALMFVHSVDSYIFNKEVEERAKAGGPVLEAGDIACRADQHGFPDYSSIFEYHGETGSLFPVGNIVGYESRINDPEKSILSDMGLEQQDFRMQSMPELNCKGSRRVLFAPYVDFQHGMEGDAVTLRFGLPSGSYATVLLDQFMRLSPR